MAENIVKFRYGTYANFVNADKDENTLYFITDEGNARLYKGDKLFTQQWQVVDGLPAIENAKPDRLYIDTVNNKLSYFNGTNYSDVLKGGNVEIASSVTAEGTTAVSSKAIYDFVHHEITALTGGSTATLISNIAAGEESGTLVITKGENNTNVTLKGVIVDPTWDETQRILTLPNTTGEKAITINFGKDMVVTSGSYDASTKDLVLVIGEDSSKTVRIPVGSLVDTYTASTDTSAAIEITVNDHEIKGSLLVESGSVLKIQDGRLAIDLSDYVTTAVLNALEQRITTLEGEVADHERRIVALNNYVTGDEMNTRIDNRIKGFDYGSKIDALTTQIDTVRSEYKSADEATLSSAKSYTDTQISNFKTYWNVIS